MLASPVAQFYSIFTRSIFTFSTAFAAKFTLQQEEIKARFIKFIPA
jgi:hypothetical protein